MKRDESAIETLRENVKPGDTVYTIVRHVSRSGMTRDISVLLMTDDGPWEVSGLVALAIGERRNRDNGGVRVGGCGMDMGFHIVYQLGHALFPDGFTCAGEGCRSNDHSNGDRDRTPHHHTDGGYALRHRWM